MRYVRRFTIKLCFLSYRPVQHSGMYRVSPCQNQALTHAVDRSGALLGKTMGPTSKRVAVEADTPKATVLISGLTTDMASKMETTEYAWPPAADADFSVQP